MSVTDLTNTTWILKNTVLSTLDNDFLVNGTIYIPSSSNIYNFDTVRFDSSVIYQLSFENNGSSVVGFILNVTSDRSDRIITFINGNDITNSTLINWFENNATQVTERYTVYTTVSPSGAGSVTGGGNYLVDTPFTVTATPYANYSFSEWVDTVTGIHYATDNPHTETPRATQEIYLTAVFTYTDPYNKDAGNLPSDQVTDTKPSGWLQLGSSKLFTIWTPTETELQTISSWLNSDNFISVLEGILSSLTSMPKLSDYIFGFYVYPFTITPEATRKKFKFGSVQPETGTVSDAYAHYTNKAYYEFDCGTLTVSPFYNGALDFQTDIQIYLPFIGYHSLETYDVIGRTINPIYQIDLMTGETICKIKIDGSIKYQFTGSCGYSIPYVEANYGGLASKLIVGAVAELSSNGKVPEVKTGESNYTKDVKRHIERRYTSKPIMSSYSNLNQTTTFRKGVTMADTGSQVSGTNTYTSPLVSPKDAFGTFTNMGGGVVRGGSLRGNTGFLGVTKPYLMIVRPHLDQPTNYGKYNGFPCNKYLTLGDLHGYTEVDEIILDGFKCTDTELSEIDTLLKGGVIL